jgi:hypothetical protein
LYRAELASAVGPRYLELNSNNDQLAQLFVSHGSGGGSLKTLSFTSFRNEPEKMEIIGGSLVLEKCVIRFDFMLEKLERLKVQYANKQKSFAAMLNAKRKKT